MNSIHNKTCEESGECCPYFASEFKSLVKERDIFLSPLGLLENALYVEKSQSILMERNPMYLSLSITWLK